MGYFRFDTPAEQEALAEVYEYLCPLYNYWYPSFRLIGKVKQADGRYKKVYEKTPLTPPYQRLLASSDVPEESKAELRRRKNTQDPVAMNSRLNEAVERLLKINGEKDKVKQPSGQAQAV